MKLVLFGGVQGIGKSTLLSWLENEFAGKITLVNPGELFRHYFYEEKLKTIEEIEELVVSTLEEMPDDAVAVAHWHYAVRRPEGYIPQIDFSKLERLARSGKIKEVVLVLVEAPVDVIIERRTKDCESKKRAFPRPVILEEMDTEQKFLAQHQVLFAKVLGNHNITVFRVYNVNLEEAKKLLGNLFQTLIGCP